MHDEPSKTPDEPAVGIFWRVGPPARSKLVAHAVALSEAEEYGDFLTHPSGHYEVWESWRAAGAKSIKDMGLPVEVAITEYEAHPRGRVVYNRLTQQYTVYADRRLQGAKTVQEIAELFGIADCTFNVRSDSHYRSSS